MPPVCSEPLAVTLTRRPDASALATWDELVRTTPGSDVAQLSAWADVRRPAGFQPLYMLVRQGTELVGGALVMTRKLPLIGEVGYVSYGPMLALDNDREAAVAEMVAALRRESKRKLRALFVQPPLVHDDISLEFCRQASGRRKPLSPPPLHCASTSPRLKTSCGPGSGSAYARGPANGNRVV
jgi:hypothetical protein